MEMRASIVKDFEINTASGEVMSHLIKIEQKGSKVLDNGKTLSIGNQESDPLDQSISLLSKPIFDTMIKDRLMNRLS